MESRRQTDAVFYRESSLLSAADGPTKQPLYDISSAPILSFRTDSSEAEHRQTVRIQRLIESGGNYRMHPVLTPFTDCSPAIQTVGLFIQSGLTIR